MPSLPLPSQQRWGSVLQSPMCLPMKGEWSAEPSERRVAPFDPPRPSPVPRQSSGGQPLHILGQPLPQLLVCLLMVVYFSHKASCATHERRQYADLVSHLLSNSSNVLIASFIGGCCYPAMGIFIAFCNWILKLNGKVAETTSGRSGRRRNSQREAPADQCVLDK